MQIKNWLIISVCIVNGAVSAAGKRAEPAPMFAYEHATVTFVAADNGQRRVVIDAEIADTGPKRAQGLMYRSRLEEKEGMLFLFQEALPRAFYMKNTHIPLDIIFAGADKKIIKIHAHTTPFSLDLLPSGLPAQYVVEVNGGFCMRYRICEGDSITFVRV